MADDPLTTLDAELVVAIEHRRYCRRRWAHSPNNDTAAAERQAQADLDQLLEQRHAAQQHQRTGGR